MTRSRDALLCDAFSTVPSPTEEECRARLGADLSAIVANTGERLVEIRPLVAGARWRDRPGSFRLTFAEGSVLKGVRLPDPERSRQVIHALETIRHPGIPDVIHYEGSALLQRWVPGTSIANGPWSSEDIGSCGRLHGYIHTVGVPADNPFADRRGRFSEWDAGLPGNLDFLAERSALHVREVEAVKEFTREPPRAMEMGFIHKDLCAENLVRATDGRLYVVDNESFTVGPYAYDLARTWYRWGLPAAQHMEYLEAYARHRDPQDFIADFPYWALVTLVKAATFRLRQNAEGRDYPIKQLRECLARFEQAGTSSLGELLQRPPWGSR